MRIRVLIAATFAAVVAAALIGTSAGQASRAAQAAAAPAVQYVRIDTTSGFLALPQDPRALAIVIHGGQARIGQSVLATRVAARVYAGHFAPLGIGVLAVDYRWSGYGGGELRDVEAALTQAARDPRTAALPKILIGASHGGYLAALAATTPVARAAPVRAIVDLYGFSNLGATVTDSGSLNDRQAQLTLRELGPPALNSRAYAARSPLSRASLLTAPLFQAVGAGDRATLRDVFALNRAVSANGGSPTLRVIRGLDHGFAFGAAANPLVWQEISNFLRGLQLAK